MCHNQILRTVPATLLCVWMGLWATYSAAQVPSEDVRPGEQQEAARVTKLEVVASPERTAVISFSLDRFSDVTVKILDEKGKVVRHLASGVLGDNPPAPLRAKSRDQEIIWDGKDDGGTDVAPGEYEVRIAVGLKAEFERILGHHPYAMGVVAGLALDADGNVYVGNRDFAKSPNRVQLFDKNGQYIRTIMPFNPDHLRKGGRELYGPVGNRRVWAQAYSGGHLVPRMGMEGSVYNDTRCGFEQLEVDKEGNIWLILNGGSRRVAAMKLDARGLPLRDSFEQGYVAPLPWEKKYGSILYSHLDKDTGFLYISDGGVRDPWDAAQQHPFVQRFLVEGVAPGWPAGLPAKHAQIVARLNPDMTPSETFEYEGRRRLEKKKYYLGVLREKGTDEAHFDGPKGIATDSQGCIIVADSDNCRIQVFRKDGYYLSTISTYRQEDQDVPLANVSNLAINRKSGRLYAMVDSGGGKRIVKFASWKDPTTIATLDLATEARQMAVDHWANLLWVANGGGQATFTRIEDKGETFGEVKHFGGIQTVGFTNPNHLTADGRGNLLVNERRRGFPRQVVRIKEDGTGWEILKPFEAARDGEFAADGQGNLYRLTHEAILKFDSHCRAATFRALGTNRIPLETRNGIWAREITVAPNGDIYITLVKREPLPEDYEGDLDLVRHHNDGYYFPFPAGLVDVYNPDGTLKKAGLVVLTAPRTIRVNRKGEIYVIESPMGCKWGRANVIKFAPTGGKVGSEGELWRRAGVSPVPPAHCGCLSGQMDLDDAGNIFVTAMRGFYIQVLDANGNIVTRIGNYGNQDCVGPGGDFPDPSIAFFVIRGVAISGDKLFVSDYGNRRAVRCALGYRESKSAKLNLPSAP